MLIIIFSIVYFIMLGLLIYLSIFKLSSLKRLIIKIIESFLFVLFFILIYKKQSNLIEKYQLYCYLGALIGSFIGDLLLGIFNYFSKKKLLYFYIGTIIFFIAQIFYINYFIYFQNDYLNYLNIALPIASCIITILTLERFKAEKTVTIVSGFYSLAVSLMFSATLIYGIKENNFIIPLAGFSFLVSDFTLAVKYFSNSKLEKTNVIITTFTYYLAQYLFIIGLL